MDTTTHQTTWRRRQLDYKLPIRTVHDREIGTFSHDTNSLRHNSFATVNLSNGLEVGLVSKARNYSTTEYEVLQTVLVDEYSGIHKMPEQMVAEFFSLTADIYDDMKAMSGQSIAIGLNQHPEGFQLPERDRFGNKQRVQTLQPLHVHVYEVSVPSDEQVTMADLSVADQRDMSDPFLEVSSAILTNRLKDHSMFKELTIGMGDPNTPPWGLNIEIPKTLSNFLRGDSKLIVELQNIIFEEYKFWSNLLKAKSGVQEGISGYAGVLPSSVVRTMQLLADSLRQESEVDSAHLFIKGGAVTYTLFENTDQHAVIGIHPRLMSRGNSADSMGIYVDNFEGERTSDLQKKKEFYQKLIGGMAMKCDIKEGIFLQKWEDR